MIFTLLVNLEKDMKMNALKECLKKSAAYINFVYYDDDNDRYAHHNYVLEQAALNSRTSIYEMTDKEQTDFDENLFKYLRNLDKNNRAVIITETTIYDDYAKIIDVFGQGCNYPTKKRSQWVAY